MIKLKPILCLLIPLCLTLLATPGHAQNTAILIEADSGRILNDVNASHLWFPASLTKVMTLYVAFNALNQRQISLHDTIPVSPHAARQPNSKLGLRTSERITVQDAILAIITRSANDAAVALGEYLGGNEENFARIMTEKAHAIGMYDSHFMNATGLPHPWQVSTARDLGLLAWRVLHDYPQFYGYFGAHSFYFRGAELRGINKFTASYPGAEGMKTGFTCGSGYNLMSSASQNGRRLIGVILGGQTSAHRYQLMVNMMNDGFSGAFAPLDKKITTIPTKNEDPAPYLLGCGNARPKYNSIDDIDVPQTPHRHHGKHPHLHKPGKPAKNQKKNAVKTPVTSKHKVAAPVKKSVNAHKARKAHRR